MPNAENIKNLTNEDIIAHLLLENPFAAMFGAPVLYHSKVASAFLGVAYEPHAGKHLRAIYNLDMIMAIYMEGKSEDQLEAASNLAAEEIFYAVEDNNAAPIALSVTDLWNTRRSLFGDMGFLAPQHHN